MEVADRHGCPQKVPASREERVVPAGEGLLPTGGPTCLSLQWDLVCEHKGLNKVISTLFFVGVLVGAVIFGYLSDR